MLKKLFRILACLLVSAGSLYITACLLVPMFLGTGISEARPNEKSIDLALGDRFQMHMTNSISNALEGVVDIKKVYWLNDHDLVAPKPNQDLYGITDDPKEIAELLQNAQILLNGQQTVLTPQTPLAPGTQVNYYLDETIYAATWKQAFGNCLYTFSEIKIAHPSQFRRFLAGGSYGSGIQLTTTEMADSVNAVVASTGDFYSYRKYGVIVYDGIVKRVNAQPVDTCYIDENADLIFSYRGELDSMEAAQAFVDEHNIRFSVAFGPVLIDNGQKTDFPGYILGEVYERYARSALCQMGPLHYLLAVCTKDGSYDQHATTEEFQNVLASFGPEKAYALDGGQSAVIAMRGKTINRVNFGYQRQLSDIIYFATAIPEKE